MDKTIIEKETEYYFLCFCSLVCILAEKKLNLPNVFIMFLKNKNYRCLFKEMMNIDTDEECIRMFIQFDPNLYKSKYITKYLNKNKKLKLL
jgi:hypothetical protein